MELGIDDVASSLPGAELEDLRGPNVEEGSAYFQENGELPGDEIDRSMPWSGAAAREDHQAFHRNHHPSQKCPLWEYQPAARRQLAREEEDNDNG